MSVSSVFLRLGVDFRTIFVVCVCSITPLIAIWQLVVVVVVEVIVVVIVVLNYIRVVLHCLTMIIMATMLLMLDGCTLCPVM